MSAVVESGQGCRREGRGKRKTRQKESVGYWVFTFFGLMNCTSALMELRDLNFIKQEKCNPQLGPPAERNSDMALTSKMWGSSRSYFDKKKKKALQLPVWLRSPLSTGAWWWRCERRWGGWGWVWLWCCKTAEEMDRKNSQSSIASTVFSGL